MAVTLVGSEGLFTRLGNIGISYLRTVSGYGSTLNDEVDAIDDEYSTSDQIVVDNLYTTRDSYRTVHGTYLSQLQSISQNTVTEQVNRDQPLPSKSLTPALTELISQMKNSSDSIKRPTTSGAVTAWGSNKGDAVINVSLTNEFGDPLDMVFSEDIKFTCGGDSASGASQYSEVFTISGEPTRTVTDYQWPGGSGATGTLTLVDAAVDGLIRNGDFADWTGTPLALTDWTIGAGTAGTHIVRDSTTLRAGTNYTCQFVSNGSTLPDLYQVVTLAPNRVYALNLWAKINTLDATGTVRVRLTDGSNTTLTDDAGNNLLTTWGVNGGSGIGTSYTKLATFFSTPRQLPSTVRLHLEWSVSPTSGRTVNFGLFGFRAAQQLYSGGPFVAGFSRGSTNSSARGDYYTLAVANNANPVGWVRHADRMFNLRQLGLYLPSSNSPTINDNLLLS